MFMFLCNLVYMLSVVNWCHRESQKSTSLANCVYVCILYKACFQGNSKIGHEMILKAKDIRHHLPDQVSIFTLILV